jgi:hypothetical protein
MTRMTTTKTMTTLTTATTATAMTTTTAGGGVRGHERGEGMGMVMAAAVNLRECAFKGQNKKYGVEYQLCFYLEMIINYPVIDEGAIQGYSRMNSKVPQTPTTRMTQSQLICQRGNYLFTHVMSETVFALDINYRVKCKKFRDLLGRLRVGEPTP